MTGIPVWLLALIPGIPGTLFLYVGLMSLRHVFFGLSGRAVGRVTGLTAPDEEGFVRPIVRFVYDGEVVTVVDETGTSPPLRRPGQPVVLRFPPGRPHESRISGGGLYLVPVAATVIGAAGVLVAVLLAAGRLR